MTSTFRARPMLPSILDEIICDDLDRRLAAVVAVCATVWASGQSSCRTPAEIAVWTARRQQHLRELLDTLTQQKDGAPVSRSPALPPSRPLV